MDDEGRRIRWRPFSMTEAQPFVTMIRLGRSFRYVLSIMAFGLVVILSGGASRAAEEDAVARGKYLFDAAGCRNCHTDTKNKGPVLGGGTALETPFGTFYGPNISPHREHGIGAWSDADFIQAMREGVSPEGRHYYPAFPYTSFTRMTDRDLKDLKAYIFSQPPVARPNRPHDLRFPYNIRMGLWLWKAFYFENGPFKPRPDRSAQWNRGAYIVEALSHCGECHTQRNAFGALDRDNWLAGAVGRGTVKSVPNITPHEETGIGNWSREEIIDALETGTLPDGDEFGSLMYDVVHYGTSKLTDADRLAIADYLQSLKPIENRIGGQ